ncbi:MAG: cysteine desulfurase [Bacilli bacterium]|nr:cysteine desulfurase [Bacilli bacterium]
MSRKRAVKITNIYLDNAATTKVHPEVLDTYIKAKTSYFANPSSIHSLGQQAKRLLDKAREQISSLLNVPNHEVIFTSGATESINLALKGYALRYQNRGKHIITSSIEHPAVSETLKQLEEEFGFTITYLPVDRNGQISLDELKEAIRKDTILVSIMAVNNEVGTILPIKEIAAILKPYPLIAFHSDVTQAIGKIDLPYQDIDMFSFSAHKFHGLNSSGCLLKRKNIELLPVNSGGGQENNYRSGTNDVANDASMSKALRLSLEGLKKNYDHVLRLADHLKEYILNNKDKYELNSGDNPYIVNFSTLNKKASVVVEALSNAGIMVSSTSACHAHKEPISEVVLAMKHDMSLAKNTIRVSFDASNTLEEVDELIRQLDIIMGEIK